MRVDVRVVGQSNIFGTTNITLLIFGKDVRAFFPRMSGAWGIWLVSTIMGLKYFTFLGITAALLMLISMQPLIRSDVDLRYYTPVVSLAALLTYAAVKNSVMLAYILPYAALLALQKYLRDRAGQRAYIQAGALILTAPFPLMAGFHGAFPSEILIPWFLLLLLTFFNVTLADSLIFEGKFEAKNYAIFSILSVSLLTLTPLPMSASVIIMALLVLLASHRLTLKKFGFSLLGIHLLFAAQYLIFF